MESHQTAVGQWIRLKTSSVQVPSSKDRRTGYQAGTSTILTQELLDLPSFSSLSLTESIHTLIFPLASSPRLPPPPLGTGLEGWGSLGLPRVGHSRSSQGEERAEVGREKKKKKGATLKPLHEKVTCSQIRVTSHVSMPRKLQRRKLQTKRENQEMESGTEKRWRKTFTNEAMKNTL